MDTLQEALFKAMLNDSWFTQSDGDVESPTGYFGYVVNGDNDWAEVSMAFQDVITAYGSMDQSEEWLKANFFGVYSANIDSNGIIHIHRHGDYVRTNTAVLGIEPTMPVRHAMQTFANRVNEFNEWSAE